jgi:hypothetical protein
MREPEPPPVHCARCGDTGFAPVAESATRAVERCICWYGNPRLAARRRLEDARLEHDRRWRQASRARRVRRSPLRR